MGGRGGGENQGHFTVVDTFLCVHQYVRAALGICMSAGLKFSSIWPRWRLDGPSGSDHAGYL